MALSPRSCIWGKRISTQNLGRPQLSFDFLNASVGSKWLFLTIRGGYSGFLIQIHSIMKIFKSKLREVSAVYKTSDVVPNAKISQSRDVADYIRQVYPVEINIREAMVVLFLNNSNRTLGYSVASIGGLTGTLVDVRLLLRDALLTQATGLILVHNHPSATLIFLIFHHSICLICMSIINRLTACFRICILLLLKRRSKNLLVQDHYPRKYLHS